MACGMLTGDGPGAAAAVAGQVGMDAALVQAALLPEDKLDWVRYVRLFAAGGIALLSLMAWW